MRRQMTHATFCFNDLLFHCSLVYPQNSPEYHQTTHSVIVYKEITIEALGVKFIIYLLPPTLNCFIKPKYLRIVSYHVSGLKLKCLYFSERTCDDSSVVYYDGGRAQTSYINPSICLTNSICIFQPLVPGAVKMI